MNKLKIFCILSSLIFSLLLVNNTETNAQCSNGFCRPPNYYSQYQYPQNWTEFSQSPQYNQPSNDENLIVDRAIAQRIRNASVITVSNANYGQYKGSGTIFSWNNSVGILTAAHVVENNQYAYIKFKDQFIRCKVLDIDKTTDWAILEPETNQEELYQNAVPLTTQIPQHGERLIFAGYGGSEKLRLWNGPLLRYTYAMNKHGDWMVTRYAAQHGDSGGGIFNTKGELVGNIWGTDGMQTYGTWIGALRIKQICFSWRFNAFENRRQRPPNINPNTPLPSPNPTPPKVPLPPTPPNENNNQPDQINPQPETPDNNPQPQEKTKPEQNPKSPETKKEPEKPADNPNTIKIIIERSLAWSGLISLAIISAVTTVILLTIVYSIFLFLTKNNNTRIL